MGFDRRFRILSDDDREEMIGQVSAAIAGLNLVNYPNVRGMLEKADGRLDLLQRMINEKLDQKNMSYEQIINQIENLTD